MIVFDLKCSGGHCFEGWFNDTGSFEEQIHKNLVACPVCGDTCIKKILSPVTTCAFRSEPVKSAQPPSINYRKLAAEIVGYINERFEDVGPNFTKEALKMHYGVTEKKNIRGSATQDEENTLRQEKIEFFKVPLPREEDDKQN